MRLPDEDITIDLGLAPVRVKESTLSKLDISPELLAGLEEKFRVWARRVLGRIYDCKYASVHNTSLEEEKKEAFIAKGLGEKIPLHYHFYGYSRGSHPTIDFFHNTILPTVVALTGNTIAERAETVCDDTLRAVEFIIANDLSFFNRYASASLLTEFFAHDTSYGISNARGQFQYFYKKYGRGTALAVAQYQGRELDKHGDCGNYTQSLSVVEGFFEKVYQRLPVEYCDEILNVVMAYGGLGGFATREANFCLDRIPGVVSTIIEANKTHLLADYFHLAQAAPYITESGSPESDYCESFHSLFDSGQIIPELEALNRTGTFKPALLQLAHFLFKASRTRFNSVRAPITFQCPARPTDGYLPGHVEKLEASGYSPEEIRDILEIPSHHPWIGVQGLYIVSCYHEIEEKYPGGVKEMLKYAEKIQNAPRSLVRFIQGCATDDLTGTQLDAYLRVGEKLVAQLHDYASIYFEKDNPSTRNLLEVLSENADKFMEFMDQILKLCSVFPEDNGSDSNAEKILRNCFFNAHDPHLPKFMAGMRSLTECETFFSDRFPRPYQKRKLSAHDYKNLLFFYIESLVAIRASETGDDFRPLYGLTLRGLPLRIDYVQLAHIMGYFYIAESGVLGVHYERYCNYAELLATGLHYQIAAQLSYFGQDKEPPATLQLQTDDGIFIEEIPGIEMSVHFDKALAVVRAIRSTRAALKGVYKKPREAAQHTLMQALPTESGVALLGMQALTKEMAADQLREQLEVIERLEGDEDIQGVMDFRALRKQLEQALHLSDFQKILGIGGILTKDYDVELPPLMIIGNEHTRMAISGTSMLLALGAMHWTGINNDIETLPGEGRFLVDPAKCRDIEASLKRYGDVLRKNLRKVLPRVEKLIIADRLRLPGLMPIGGKVHTKTAMSEDLIAFMQDVFGLGNTAFRLIHAGGSLLLPAMPSSIELQMIVTMLQKFGVVDREGFDLQLGMAGRLSRESAPLVGSSVVLATNTGVKYAQNSFSTTHDSITGARIMAFDAGVKVTGLPFDLPQATGRTDMLGRHDLADIELYRLVGSIAAHEQFGGMFGNFMGEYRTGFMEILCRYGLDRTLSSSAWVYDHASPDDSLSGHERMIQAFTNAWHASADRPRLGIIGEVRELQQRLERNVRAHRDRIMIAQPDEIERLRNF